MSVHETLITKLDLHCKFTYFVLANCLQFEKKSPIMLEISRRLAQTMAYIHLKYFRKTVDRALYLNSGQSIRGRETRTKTPPIPFSPPRFT